MTDGVDKLQPGMKVALAGAGAARRQPGREQPEGGKGEARPQKKAGA